MGNINCLASKLRGVYTPQNNGREAAFKQRFCIFCWTREAYECLQSRYINNLT